MIFHRRRVDESKQERLSANELLREVLDPLLILDEHLRVTIANPAFYATFELTPEQTLEQPIREVGGGLWDTPELRELLHEVRERGKRFQDYELTHEFRSIGRRTMLLNAGPIEPTATNETLILLAMKDITRRREAEEALRESEQKLRMIFENVSEFAIIGMDLEGRVTTWNPGARRLLGYEASEIIGHDARIIFTPEDRQRGAAEHELQSALKSGRAENERWHVRKDGSRFWGSGLVMPLYDDRHRPRGLLKIMRDMTAQHRLREREKAHAEELERRVAEATTQAHDRARQLEMLTHHLQHTEQRERRRLAKVLHDDLQQLLVAANMRIQMIQNESAAATALQDAREILDQAIDQSRSLSHELSPAVLWDRGFVPALHWLGSIIGQRHQLPVEVKADQAVNDIVPPESGETILQMVRELLFNVVKHAEASVARVVAEPIGETGLYVTVEDDGIGFDPAKLEAQANDSSHGLHDIRERLALWQGELTIAPRPTRGCCVALTIPEIPERSQAPRG